jgi:hypothetical protein
MATTIRKKLILLLMCISSVMIFYWYFFIGIRVSCHPAIMDEVEAKEFAIVAVKNRYGDISARHFRDGVDSEVVGASLEDWNEAPPSPIPAIDGVVTLVRNREKIRAERNKSMQRALHSLCCV